MAASTKTWLNDNPPQVDDVDLNGFERENNLLIQSSGQALNTLDNTQTSKAVSNYTAGADFYGCSGSLNNYVLTETSIAAGTFEAPTQYFDGMNIRFLPSFVNTDAATVNVAGIGVVDLLRADGTPLQQNDLSTSLVVFGTYLTSGFRLSNVGGNTSAVDVTNVVIGGCATTNPWQRGITKLNAIVAGSYEYLADRIYVNAGADTTANLTYSKSTDAPALSVSNYFSANSFEFETTTTQSSFPGGDEGVWVGYAVEGYDFAKLAQRNTIVSFVAKSDVPGIYSIALTNGGQTYSVVKQITLTSSYQLFVIIFPPSPALGTWDYGKEIGLNLLIALSPSSYVTGTLNTWQASRFQTGAGQANLVGTANAKFNLDQLFIAAGSVFNGYNEMSAPSLLDSCQRYFQKTYNNEVYAGAAIAAGNSRLIVTPATFASQLMPGIYLPRRLRKTGGLPKFYRAVTGVVNQLLDAATASTVNISAATATETYVHFTAAYAGLTNGNILEGDYTIECELGII